MHQTHISIGILIILSPGFIFGKILMPVCVVGLKSIFPGCLARDVANSPRGAILLSLNFI